MFNIHKLVCDIFIYYVTHRYDPHTMSPNQSCFDEELPFEFGENLLVGLFCVNLKLQAVIKYDSKLESLIYVIDLKII